MRMGTSILTVFIITTIKDHPHAYGDKKSKGRDLLTHLGSSPRVWGQVEKKYQQYLDGRIIPTRMGTRIQ